MYWFAFLPSFRRSSSPPFGGLPPGGHRLGLPQSASPRGFSLSLPRGVSPTGLPSEPAPKGVPTGLPSEPAPNGVPTGHGTPRGMGSGRDFSVSLPRAVSPRAASCPGERGFPRAGFLPGLWSRPAFSMSLTAPGSSTPELPWREVLRRPDLVRVTL